MSRAEADKAIPYLKYKGDQLTNRLQKKKRKEKRKTNIDKRQEILQISDRHT